MRERPCWPGGYGRRSKALSPPTRSTLRKPCSWALRAALSAAICAANGVDLREPLKPTWPADAQLITLPTGSVIETIVLLKVLLMCACPCAMFFFSLRRTFLAPAFLAGPGIYFPPPTCPAVPAARFARADPSGQPQAPSARGAGLFARALIALCGVTSYLPSSCRRW